MGRKRRDASTARAAGEGSQGAASLPGTGPEGRQSKKRTEELFGFPLLSCGLAMSFPSVAQGRWPGL